MVDVRTNGKARRSRARRKHVCAPVSCAKRHGIPACAGTTVQIARVSTNVRQCIRAIVMALCVALAPAIALAQPDPNKVMRYGFEIAETGFDPAQTSDWYSAIVSEQIFDTPLAYDYLARPIKLKPNVLSSLPDISADGRSYTLRLKKGIYFADDPAFNGKKRELVAADIAYSMKRLFDPKTKSPNLYLLEGLIVGMDGFAQRQNKAGKFDYDVAIEGLQLLDRYTLQIQLTESNFNFLYRLASHNSCAIVAREVVEKYGDDIMAHPVGSGPYKLGYWKRSSKISLEPNPGFREEYFEAEPAAGDEEANAIYSKLKGRRLPMIGHIDFQVIEEDQPRWLAFLNEEHDMIDRVPLSFSNMAVVDDKLLPHLAKRGIQMSRMAGLEVTYAYFAMENPVVGGYAADKVALRRAMVLGYNTLDEIRVVMKNQAVPAQSPIGPGAFGYEEGFRTIANDFNPAKARALLDMYGYIDRDGDGYRENPDGTPLLIEQASSPDQRSKMFDELWKRSMDAIGINIVFKKAKWPDLLKESKAGKLMSWRLGWGAGYPDAEAFFVMLYGPNSGQANHARFKLAEFDRLFERARGIVPGPERNAIYREMNRLFLVNAPWKLGAHRMYNDLMHPWVTGWMRHPTIRAGLKFVDIDLAVQKEKLK